MSIPRAICTVLAVLLAGAFLFPGPALAEKNEERWCYKKWKKQGKIKVTVINASQRKKEFEVTFILWKIKKTRSYTIPGIYTGVVESTKNWHAVRYGPCKCEPPVKADILNCAVALIPDWKPPPGPPGPPR